MRTTLAAVAAVVWLVAGLSAQEKTGELEQHGKNVTGAILHALGLEDLGGFGDSTAPFALC